MRLEPARNSRGEEETNSSQSASRKLTQGPREAEPVDGSVCSSSGAVKMVVPRMRGAFFSTW